MCKRRIHRISFIEISPVDRIRSCPSDKVIVNIRLILNDEGKIFSVYKIASLSDVSTCLRVSIIGRNHGVRCVCKCDSKGRNRRCSI